MKYQIVISSDARKLGKTMLACKLVETFKSAGLSVSCIKLSKGTHGSKGPVEEPGSRGSDTYRFSNAGASNVVLFRYSLLEELAEAMNELTSDADIQIWESNTVLNLLKPDFHIHLLSDSYVKSSAEELSLNLKADLTAKGPLKPEAAEKISMIVPGLMKIRGISPFSIEGKHWIELKGESLFGQGRIQLLKAVKRTGSILQASRETGVPYKRAWILLRDAENRLGADLIRSERGGSEGGGSSLTNLAERILEIWDRSETDFRDLLNQMEV